MSSSSPANSDQRCPQNLFASVPQDIIQTQILNRIDGSTLAAVSCVSTELRSLCDDDDHLWRRICNSTWESSSDPRVSTVIEAFPFGYRSFYADAFPPLRYRRIGTVTAPGDLISAVDIQFDGRLIYSEVLVTETRSSWFLKTPFVMDLFHGKESPPSPSLIMRSEHFSRLSLSWILIDPCTKRAINVASQKAVEVRRIADDYQLRYATVVGSRRDDNDVVEYAVTVTCHREDSGKLRLRQVSLQFQDIDGKNLTGKECLRVVGEAMEGRRRNGGGGELGEGYGMFVRMREMRKGRKLELEKRLEMAIMVAVEIAVFLGLVRYFLWS